MVEKDRILGLIRLKGPLLPLDVAKLLGTSTLIASAHLSELTSKGAVKVSRVKVGGSPLYYLPGQEPRLQEYSDRLHEKEKRAYEHLKSRLVLRDQDEPAVMRYALRQIRDFAKPVEVKIGDAKTLFWRWYLAPMAEVEKRIRERYIPTPQQSVEPKPSVQSKHTTSEAINPVQSSFNKQLKTGPIASPTGFLQKVHSFFSSQHIGIEHEEVEKKGKQASFIIKVPSAVGPIKFYVRAKSKKRITEGDLSEAVVKAGNRPILFITNGKLTKASEAMLGKDFSSLIFKRL